MTTLFGIGSQIWHDEFGDGVVINLKASSYTVTFTELGVKILKFDATYFILEALEPDGDLVSLFDVEQSLTRVLQRWVD